MRLGLVEVDGQGLVMDIQDVEVHWHHLHPTPRGGGGYSTQRWVSTVKLIEQAVVANLHTEGAVTFP